MTLQLVKNTANNNELESLTENKSDADFENISSNDYYCLKIYLLERELQSKIHENKDLENINEAVKNLNNMLSKELDLRAKENNELNKKQKFLYKLFKTFLLIQAFLITIAFIVM